jgi:hypothetical protein
MGVVYNKHGQAAEGLGKLAMACARWQVAWVTSPASHLPDLAGIPTTCPNSLLSLKSNAQLMGVVYNKHGQAAAG